MPRIVSASSTEGTLQGEITNALHPHIASNIANALACSVVASRLDFCNSGLVRSTLSDQNDLQRSQNHVAQSCPRSPQPSP
ncbi:unnamed protein product [Lampetra fluviatilis]